MTILLDAMGGDNAPEAVIRGAIKAVNEIKSDIILIGNENVINKKLKEIYKKDSITEISNRIKIYNTTEEITMEDTPTVAIKNKKDSSMVVGFRLLKEEKGDVFVSAGNSGALLAGATLLIGRIKGIDRPAMAPMIPSYKKSVMLMDAGANTNCKPINLIQFAQMANIYLKNVLKIERPKIGLLNIGTEETKGNELTKETYKLLSENSNEYGINFVGNIEGRDIFSGEIDAVIADGFTGNVVLKTVEGLGKFIKKSLTENLNKNTLTKLAAIPTLPAIKSFAKTMDYKEYGGALFLGVKRPIVKAHGSSDEKLFYYTIKQAEKFAENRIVEMMFNEFEKK